MHLNRRNRNAQRRISHHITIDHTLDLLRHTTLLLLVLLLLIAIVA